MSLTRHAVRRIAQTKSLAEELAGEKMIMQIFDLALFTAADMKKNIKARVQISDGNSKMTCMITEKTYDSISFTLQNFDVIELQISKNQFQLVNDRPVLILKFAPKLIQTNLSKVIGVPEDYKKNVEKNNFPTSTDLRIPGLSRPSDIENIEDALSGIDISEEMQQNRFQPVKEPQRKGEQKIEAQDQYMPIKALNQFTTDWRFKSRILRKPPIREYKNDKGPGKIMKLELVDREGTMIEATMFNEVADKWMHRIEENKVYIFANGQVKMANKKFTSIKNDFCLTFGNETEIQECKEDASIKTESFSFTNIELIKSSPPLSTIDVIGVIFELSPVSQIRTKTGMKDRLTIVVADDTKFSIPVTLWGEICNIIVQKIKLGDIIVLRQCRVSDYSGRTLNASSDIKDALTNVQDARSAQLKKWYQSTTREQHLQSIQSLSTQQQQSSEPRPDNSLNIAEIIEDSEKNTEIKNSSKSAYYKVSGYCNFFNTTEESRPLYYLACPVCKKKVADEINGYRCENCSKSFSEAVPTYNFAFKLLDYSHSILVQCLGEVGESILGISAINIMQSEDTQQLKTLLNERMFNEITLLIRASVNQSQPDQIRYTAGRVFPESLVDENKQLLKRLEIYASKV